MKRLITLLLFAGLVGSTDKAPKFTLKSLDEKLNNLMSLDIEAAKATDFNTETLVSHIQELESRVEALEKHRGLPIAQGSLRAPRVYPPSSEKLNHFADEYGKFINKANAGVVDIQQWEKVKRLCGGL